MPHESRSRRQRRPVLIGRPVLFGLRLARRGPAGGDDGFILLESIVSIMLISVLMAALTPFFANSVNLMSRERASQTATQIATSSVETVRGLPPSDLVTGHDAASVASQYAAAPAALATWLDPTVMTPAVDSRAAAGAGSSAVVPTTAQARPANNIAYSVTTYLGWCNIPAGGTDADCAAATTSDSVQYVRAVVAVTWSQTRCPTSGCSYVTATLISATGDPTFNLKQAPPAVPLVISPGNQTSTIGTAITPLQLAVQAGTGVPTLTWAVTAGALPIGIALTPAGLISGVPTLLTPALPVTVTVTDAFQRTASTSFTWTVVAAPTVLSPGPQRSSVGTAITVPLTTTCPASPCTYALLNGPPGLTVSSAGVITGTISGPAQTFGAVTVQVTDTNGATATSGAFTWTIVAPPSVTAPGNQTTTTGAAVSLALSSTCPGAPCTYALISGPAGLTISATGLITGIVTSPAQTFPNVTVTITDRSGLSVSSTAFSWLVLAKPTVTSPGAQTTTVGATVSLALTTACPNSPCAYVLANGPAGLSISAAGVVTGTVTSAAQTFPAATVTVTDAGGTTATSAAFAWTVLAKPSVTAPANQTTASGGTASSVTLTKSCPNTPCTYVLNNGPAGLAISTAGVISGTVTSPAQVFGAVSVTVTDAAGVSATSGTFTWTVTYSAISANVPSTQKSTQNTTITPLQLTATGGSGSVTWSLVTPLPNGLTLSSSGLITGTPLLVGSTSVSVRATDTTAGYTSTATFTWTVVARPTIGPPGVLVTTVGATRSVALAYTCPYASCTLTLTNGVPGLGLSTTTPVTTNNTALTVTVTATSGTVYVAGVVQPSAVTSGTSTLYAPTVTITDGAGAAASSGAGSWRVYLAPTISSPGTLTATEGTVKSVPLSYTCPYPTCTITLTGTVPGLGLTTSSTATGNVTTTSLLVSAASGTVYIGGTVQSNAVTSGTSASYSPTVKIADAGATASPQVSGSWTIFEPPTLGALGARSVTISGTETAPMAYSCPSTPCTISISNAVPGLGLSLSPASGTTTTTTSLTVPDTGGTVYLTGLVGSAAVTSGTSRTWAMSVTVTDSGGATGSTSATWTAYTAPTITPIGSQAAQPGRDLALQATASCPNGGCTWAAAAQIAGDPTWYPQVISSTGRLTYSNPPAGVYSVRITVTDADSVSTQTTFPLTVTNWSLTIPNQSSSRPLTGTRTVTVDVSALISPQAAGYTYTLSGAPIWLSISASGVLTATLTPVSFTDNSITVTVTSTGSPTSTISSTFSWTVS